MQVCVCVCMRACIPPAIPSLFPPSLFAGVRTTSLRILREVLKTEDSRFKDYAELMALKVLKAFADSDASVSVRSTYMYSDPLYQDALIKTLSIHYMGQLLQPQMMHLYTPEIRTPH